MENRIVEHSHGLSVGMKRGQTGVDSSIEELRATVVELRAEIAELTKTVKVLSSNVAEVHKVIGVHDDKIELCNTDGDVILRISDTGIDCAGLHIHNDSNDDDDEELLTVDGVIFCKQVHQKL